MFDVLMKMTLQMPFGPGALYKESQHIAWKICLSEIGVNSHTGSGHSEKVSAFMWFSEWGKKVSYNILLFSSLVSTSLVWPLT